jgi:spore maturation protein CgeB
MKISSVLFIGAKSGTGQHRLNSLIRMGYLVDAIDPDELIPFPRLGTFLEWHISPALVGRWISAAIKRLISNSKYDLVFVDNGSIISYDLLKHIKQNSGYVVNFNHDDAFGMRDAKRFSMLREVVPLYDLMIVVREENVFEAFSYGAQKVLHTYRTFDVEEHASTPDADGSAPTPSLDVCFVGTWMPNRGKFISRLSDLGVPISIFGSGWNKAPEWGKIKGLWKSDHLNSAEYKYTVQSSKICLGLLAHENRDRHTTRSLEIPALGGLLCAERTTEHLRLYDEGVEAVFWSSVEECAALCLALLADEPLRKRIAMAGRQRALLDNHSNDKLIANSIKALNAESILTVV